MTTERNNIKNTIVKLLFPVFVLLMLLYGAYYGINEGKWSKIEFENRAPYHQPSLQENTWISRSFQDSVNLAMADQLPYAIGAREKYYWFTNGVLYEVQKRMFTFTDYYVHFRKTMYLYGDGGKPYMMYDINPDTDKCFLDTLAWRMNDVSRENPQVDFFVYYIEKESDMRMDSKFRRGFYERLRKDLLLPKSHVSRFRVDSFDDYKRYYYRTDHHWQYAGSYKGYREIFALLGLDAQGEPPVPCGDSILVSSTHHGSKNWQAASGSKFQEDFYAYDYKFASMRIYRIGEEFVYGKEKEYFANKDSYEKYMMKYGKFYGSDFGELIFDTGRENRPNILIMGDSFDNAILKLIAGHYNRTYSVDLRYYERQRGEKFNMTNYIRNNNIKTVLFCGNSGMYFNPEFREF